MSVQITAGTHVLIVVLESCEMPYQKLKIVMADNNLQIRP